MANDYWSGRRGRPSGGMRGSRAQMAHWADDYYDDGYIDEPPMWNPRHRMRGRPDIDMLTARLERLAERLDPYGTEPERPDYDADPRYAERPRSRDFSHEAEMERLVASAAHRSRDAGDARIAQALELLTQALGQKGIPPLPPAEATPAAPPEAVRQPDRLRSVEERIAHIGEMLGDGRTPDTAPPEPEAPAPSLSPVNPSARLREAVLEIAARQQALDGTAAKDLAPRFTGSATSEPAAAAMADDDRVRALEERIADMAKRFDALTARPAPQTPDPETASLRREMTGLNGTMRELATRIGRIQDNSVNPSTLQAIYRALDSIVQRLNTETPGLVPSTAIDQMQQVMESLTTRLEKARPGEEVCAVLEAIQRSIEHLAVRVDQAVQAPTTGAALSSMQDALDSIAQRMVTLDGLTHRVERLSSIENALHSLTKEVRAAQAARPSVDLTPITSVLNEIRSRFPTLDVVAGRTEKLSAIEAALQSLTHDVRAGRPSPELASVKNTLDDISERFASLETMAGRAEKLGAIESAIQNLALEVRTAPAPKAADLSAFQSTLDDINHRVSAIDSIAGSAHKLDGLEHTIEHLIEELKTTRAAVAVTPDMAAADALANVERAISDLSSRFDNRAGALPESMALTDIQRAIENLADRLDSSTASGAPQDAHLAVQKAMETLEGRLASSNLDGHSVTALEDMAARLSQMFDETREASIEAAQAAAARAVRDALTDVTHVPSVQEERLASLADSLSALQDQSHSSAQRTAEAFDTVRNTLERIVERLAKLEDDDHVPQPGAPASIAPSRPVAPAPAAPSAGLQADARPSDPIAAARAAARRALEERDNAQAEEPPSTVDARDKRLRFIAAARRAAGSAGAPEQAANDTGTEADEGAPSTTRRRLLIGLAAILLVLGSFQFARMAVNGSSTSDEPVIEQAGQPDTSSASQSRDVTIDTIPAFAAAPPSGSLAGDASIYSSLYAPNATLTTGSIGTGSATAARPSAPSAALDVPERIGGADLVAAAQAGDAAAMYEIGVRLFDGEQVTRDLATAAEWFKKAAETGFAPGQYRYANALDKGHGVASDLKTAEIWYRRAAEQGHIKAMHNLAVIHAEGGLGASDYNEAAHWFRMAAERGVRDSQYNLAVMLARGLGVEHDLSEAFKWFSIVAEAGDEDAAAKRDQVAAKLEPGALIAARLEARIWQPLPSDAKANGSGAPEGGWDGTGRASAQVTLP